MYTIVFAIMGGFLAYCVGRFIEGPPKKTFGGFNLDGLISQTMGLGGIVVGGIFGFFYGANLLANHNHPIQNIL